MTKPFTLTVVLFFCVSLAGCSPVEQIEWSDDFPILAPATQTAKRTQQQLDPLAEQGEALANAVRDASRGAQAIGIPGAGLVVMIAGVLGTVLGVYNERRRGTLPLRSAMEQVVQSVEAAFPDKGDMHKSIMASKQDRATRRIVSEIKGE